MRTLILATSLLALAACGGNWSNSDLEFANALPDRSDLKATLPTEAGSGAMPLTGGLSQRRDGLALGDPSPSYATTLGAQLVFNGILDYFLSALDTLRAIPPTRRSVDSRTWGPYVDSRNPSWQFQATVRLTAEGQYAWDLSALPAAGGAAVVVVDGTFTASGGTADAGTLRRGQGGIRIHVKEVRAAMGVEAGLQGVDLITLQYRTDASPTFVRMQADFTPGVSTISALYECTVEASGAGSLHFLVQSTSLLTTTLDTLARWTASGAGQTVAQVTLGTYLGATATECWSDQFKVTFHDESWLGGLKLGTASACPAFP